MPLFNVHMYIDISCSHCASDTTVEKDLDTVSLKIFQFSKTGSAHKLEYFVQCNLQPSNLFFFPSKLILYIISRVELHHTLT